MKKISTKELYLVYLRGSDTPKLAHKKSFFQFTDIFTQKTYECELINDRELLKIKSAYPIITNLPYITEKIAHQIIEQEKFVLFDKSQKKKGKDHSNLLVILPLHVVYKNDLHFTNYPDLISENVTFGQKIYVLAKYINSETMEDFFTQTRYFSIFNVEAGECGYSLSKENRLGDVVEIDSSKYENLEDEIIQLLQEKNKRYYMDVEYPQNKVKKLMKFIKN